MKNNDLSAKEKFSRFFKACIGAFRSGKGMSLVLIVEMLFAMVIFGCARTLSDSFAGDYLKARETFGAFRNTYAVTDKAAEADFSDYAQRSDYQTEKDVSIEIAFADTTEKVAYFSVWSETVNSAEFRPTMTSGRFFGEAQEGIVEICTFPDSPLGFYLRRGTIAPDTLYPLEIIRTDSDGVRTVLASLRIRVVGIYEGNDDRLDVARWPGYLLSAPLPYAELRNTYKYVTPQTALERQLCNGYATLYDNAMVHFSTQRDVLAVIVYAVCIVLVLFALTLAADVLANRIVNRKRFAIMLMSGQTRGALLAAEGVKYGVLYAVALGLFFAISPPLKNFDYLDGGGIILGTLLTLVVAAIALGTKLLSVFRVKILEDKA